MAQTYEQWKKSYESLDDAQKKQYADIAQSKGADYIGSKYLAQYSGGQQAQATSPSVKQASDQRTQEVVNKANQTQSTLNSLSQTAAQYASRNAQVGTGDVAEMPEQPKVSSVQQSTQDKFAKSWDNMTAAQQQAALTKKGMLDYINSKGLTVKKEETPATTTTKPKQTTYTTPKQQEWDYQDNSQARMDEIARNLNGFRQTNPELFQDPSTFYGFFIDGKGRSQDQIDYLWNYYDRVKKYSKYDNMPASSLGEGLADGSIPKDYLDYIKGVDTQKYQEILSYKQDGEDRIKNESYLEDLSSMAGYESEESYLPKYPDELSYAFETWQLVDEDENGVDDRLYVPPTDEERQDVDRINTINSRRMEIKNMQKNLLDDLVEQYPGVPKATLMGIVQDRTKDLSREYDDLGVELVQLQGTVDYLQNERKVQIEAGQQTINNLQDAYGMYYNYTPAGIIAKARAQYEASNITLDQADSGNETQKQMALQNVLDGYYAKYGDIIQRSEQQVINDVIAYAKKNGIGLAQALQENFVQPLQQKPGFAALSSVSATRPDVFKIGEDTYGYWDDNGNLVSVGASITGTGVGTMRTERNNNPTAMTVDVAKSLGGVEGVDYVKGDSFQTSDGRTLYTAKLLGDPIETTIKLLDNAASTGRGAFYTKGGAQRRNHTAMSDAEWLKLSPEEKQNVVLKMLQREGGDINKMAGYNQGVGGDTGTGGYNEGLLEIYKQWRDKPDSASAVKDFWNTYGDTISAAGVSKDDFLKQYDAWYEMETADAYLDILSHLDQLIELTGGEYDRGERGASIFGAGDVGRAYEYIKNNLTVQGLRDAKQQGLKLGVLSDSDVRMIGNASTTLSWTQGQKSWNGELNSFREKLLSKNKYLRDRYQNKSAYSDDVSISFNSGDKTFTIGETVTSEPKKEAKSIKNLGK